MIWKHIYKTDGEAYHKRYADGFLIMVQYENGAKAVMNVIPKRLARPSLKEAPEKTRIMPFGRSKGQEMISFFSDAHT